MHPPLCPRAGHTLPGETLQPRGRHRRTGTMCIYRGQGIRKIGYLLRMADDQPHRYVS